MDAAAPRRPLPDRTTLLAELTAVTVLAVAVTAIWAAAGQSYFWPMWVFLAIAIVLSVHLGIVWAWAQPEGRRRQLAMHGMVTAILVGIQVVVWAMTGAGFFWPVFSLFALGGIFAVHAAVSWPKQRDLEVRVQELTRTRRGALDVQGAELRRIERDLHDGAQARLVALSIQLGRAEERLEDQPETAQLVRRAREEATAAIAELRDLARGIAPPVLADRGLAAAVQALADRSAPAVSVDALVPIRPPLMVETAAYFVAAESITNAAKHAPGATVRIAIAESSDKLIVSITDDGPGGADPRGAGLTGLRQRVEALDGHLEISSPLGSGTTIRADLPCVW